MELGDALGLLEQSLAEISTAVGPTVAGDDLFRVLTATEQATRLLDRIAVTALGVLDRGGEFSSRGYRSATTAVADLTGCERSEAHQRVRAAEGVCDRVGLDGTALPPKLPATAEVFAAGRCSLAHVEVISRALESGEAGRLTPHVWAKVEEDLAEKSTHYSAQDLRGTPRN